MTRPPLLIFTDMDGTLLDHFSYSHQPAAATLQKLKNLEIPVIANTSKTFSELLALRKTIGNTDAFIAENGAAIYLPKSTWPEVSGHDAELDEYWVKEFCLPRAHWQQLITSIASEFAGEFSTFAEGGIDAIMKWTGLNEEDARLAADRHYGEPIRWLGTEQRAKEFRDRLQKMGGTALQGGRFMHLSGNSDKGRSMQWLSELYGSPPTLAAGDGDNDIAMLDAADFALVIKSPVNPAPKLHNSQGRLDSGNLIYSRACGPEGWAEGVAAFLEKLQIK